MQEIERQKDVLDALEEICSSEHFSEAGQIKKFLRYIVSETLSGRGDRIKSYSVGVEALGKGPDFDPSQDPIVRITANRLRSALAKYYNDADQQPKVIIRLPKGHYIPVFDFSDETGKGARAARIRMPRSAKKLVRRAWGKTGGRWLKAAALAALPILGLVMALWSQAFSDPPSEGALGRTWIVVQRVDAPGLPDEFATRLGEKLIAQLTRYDGVTVVDEARISLASSVTGSLLPTAAMADNYVFSLAASVYLHDTVASVRWYLTDMRTHQVMWASDGRVPVDETDPSHAVVLSITGEMLGLEGAIPVILDRDHDSAFESDFACLATAQRHVYTEDLPLLREFTACLQRVVTNYPNSGHAWALLSLAYHRQGLFAASFGQNPSFYLEKQVQASQRANASSPETFFPRLAQLAVAYDTGQTVAFEGLASRMLERYGGDPRFKSLIGQAFVAIGQPEKGLSLIEAGLRQTPAIASLGHLALALERYGSGDVEEALRILDTRVLPADYRYWLVRTVVLSQLNSSDAQEAWNSVLLLRPGYEGAVCDDLRHSRMSQNYYTQIIADLGKIAGMLPEDCAGATELALGKAH